jgi:hypothetical protein
MRCWTEKQAHTSHDTTLQQNTAQQLGSRNTTPHNTTTQHPIWFIFVQLLATMLCPGFFNNLEKISKTWGKGIFVCRKRV